MQWLRGLLVCALTISASVAYAQTAPPQTDERLRDAEFGVSTRQFGLQRSVRMYQWQRTGSQYRRVWSELLIDSSDYPAQRRNPRAMPIATRYWIAQHVRIDGKPVDEDVLKQLGQWRDFRPNFSALPGNLSATFQPEGDGLGSAENPLVPEVGDLRITWREMALPALSGRIALQNGRWMPIPQATALANPTSVKPLTATPAADSKLRVPGFLQTYWWGMLAGVVALLMLYRRRRR